MTIMNEDSSSDLGNLGTPGSSSASNGSRSEDQAASALKSSVLADAQGLSDGAKHLATDAVTQVRKSAQNQVLAGKDRLADGLESVADAIRQTGEKLGESEQSSLTDYVTRAADGVEAASDYLKEKNIADVLGDVGSFARREPAVFLGGAFVLGLLGGRFLKSSHVNPGPSTGSRGDSQASGRSKQATGRQGAGGESRGKSASRNSSLSSNARPMAVELRRDNGDGGARGPQDDGAKLPGNF